MKNILSLFLVALICSVGFAQQNNIFRIDSLPPQGILLDKGWKFHAGDNPDFSKPDFDDSKWESIDPTKDIHDFPNLFDSQVRWLRLTLHVTQQLPQPLGLAVNQATGSEVYLNGKLIHKIGQVNATNIEAQDPLDYPFYLPIDSAGTYHLAVRLVVQPRIHYTRMYALTQNNVFNARLVDLVKNHNEQRDFRVYYTGLEVFKIGLLFMLFVLHLSFYLYEKSNKTHLFLSIYFLGAFMQYVFKIIGQNTFSVEARYWYLNLSAWSTIIGILFALWSFYRLSKTRFDVYFVIVLTTNIVGGVLSSITYGMLWSMMSFASAVINFLVTLRLTRIGLKKKDKGFIMLGVAVMLSSLGFVAIELLNQNVPIPPYVVDVFFNLSAIAIPVGLSLYMGIEASERNKELQARLTENENLKVRAIAQEQEKQQILASQNETLEKQVHERTAELEHKNRDLEIEGALDKIRSTSLAMRHSDELENVVAVLFEKLKELGLVFDGGTGIHLFNEGSKDAIIWVFAPFQPPTKINLPYDEAAFEDNNIILDVWQAHETGNHIVNKTYSFEEKNKYFNYVFKHNDATQVPEEARHFILSLPSYTASFIAEKHSLLGANSWTGQCFSEIEFEILRRMARVFEQAYTRFLDLQKAEAQAREAQIEAALERVRSASLAIHQSHELEKVVVVLFDKLNELGVPFDSAFIYFFEKSTRNIEAWVATKQLSAPIKVNMPYDESVANNPILVDLWYAFENGEHGLNKSYKEKDKDDYYRYEAKHNPSLIPASVTDLQLEAESWTTTFASEKNSIVGFDSWSGHLTTIEDFQLLKRFAKVFEQAYIRFLDLQKAEAQAREAQIEAALERVRSRTMSMYSSTELREVVVTIYDQLQHLGFTNGALGIVIMDNPSGDMDWWMAGFGKENYPENYYIPYFDHPFYLAQLNAWKQGQKYVTIEVSGQSKKAYDEVIFSKTGFVRIPLETQKIMSDFEQITFSNANMKYGALSWGIEPLDNDHVQILQRFAVVFEQTYTRFLDLQKKEEQAVKLAEEKQKLEKTLNELRSTQAQLIQKEKLASLGELTAGIAHEIQNPLNFVNNFSELSVELIEEAPLPPEGEYDENWIPQEAPPGGWGPFFDDLRLNLQKINLHGKRASSIVKGMLEHARASTGIKEWTDINALADEYLRLAYNGTRAKNGNFEVAIETHFAPNLPTLDVIPQDIGRVLLNLINNAFWAVKTVEKPKVVVKTEQMENQIMITVKDNGIGMSDQIKAKIFQPFFTTKPTGEGTGLGLSLAYDIVTKGHGGTIEVESLEGEGTTFTVKLPILT